ncbi:uncharacterized protein LOC129605549 [Condylostylus longicornis]|uniref:uncharacterized protein LOC129605549 n=1 Tax=Condylostylus longicornis TaxID=2530218 RepID=UPI00244E2CC4|nr:uncharacterized protein LOC129605549 [Condylostylus longicornis]
MNHIVKNIKQITTKYPVTRGMITYSITWPASSLIQQTMEGKEKFDWCRVMRFGLFGGFFVAPTLYGWIKVASAMYPGTNLKIAIVKAIVETISYTPAAMTCFYYLMTLFEGEGFEAASTEVKNKFLPTYKAAVSIWPVVAVINFGFVPEKNRVVFISICSFMWSIFLAYMKHLDDIKDAPKFLTN